MLFITIRQNNPELINKPKLKREVLKEWTFLKVLTRLLLYPFSILILWFSITSFLPDGKIVLGLFGIAIALAYPIADILLIFGKKQKQ